jgi:ABC-type uncharacterized transport system permease subunit
MLLTLSAILLYLVSLAQLVRKRTFMPILGAAVLLHIAGLVIAASFSFTASLSWVAALMACVSLWHGVIGERFLPLIGAIAAIITISAHYFFPGTHPTSNGWQIQLHAALALSAHALLSLAGVQAVLVLFAERRFRQRTQLAPGAASWIPPLSRLERQLFQLIAVGFSLLTLTLVSGALFISDWFAQHIVHKTVLTLVAWTSFGVLLFGQIKWGWRGQRAARLTLIALAFLLLAFFGSKLVLELILKRV